jgi:hypothetical protein
MAPERQSQRRSNAAVKTAKMPVIGYWKITDMEVWDHDYVDLVVPGFIEFDNADGDHVTGSFQFGTVSGGLHAHVREIGSESFIEWSWEGRNDNDPGSGRGWAKIVGDQLIGRIYLHLGDDSAFTAERQERPLVASRGRKAHKTRLTKL